MNIGELCLIIASIGVYTFVIYNMFYICYIRGKSDKTELYKKEMQNAQNTAKQYKKSLKEKKKGFKTLQKKYSCLEAENQCLRAKLCNRGKK